MRFDVLTIFPEAFPGPLGVGVVGRAANNGLLEIRAHDLREYAEGPRQQVDDAAFGGTAGMVMKPEPLIRAVRDLREKIPKMRAILMDPKGRPFTQSVAAELREEQSLLLVCG